MPFLECQAVSSPGFEHHFQGKLFPHFLVLFALGLAFKANPGISQTLQSLTFCSSIRGRILQPVSFLVLKEDLSSEDLWDYVIFFWAFFLLEGSEDCLYGLPKGGSQGRPAELYRALSSSKNLERHPLDFSGSIFLGQVSSTATALLFKVLFIIVLLFYSIISCRVPVDGFPLTASRWRVPVNG